MEQVTSVIAFWRDVVGPERWFDADPLLDQELRLRFERLWRKARVGALEGWEESPAGRLALILLLDTFPRRMFRGTREAWRCDGQARAVAERALARGDDACHGAGCGADPLEGAVRLFFYMPFLHAEDLRAQERGLALIAEHIRGAAEEDARARHMVIRRFGRFPWRNAAVGRHSSDEEAAFLWAGGYDWALRAQRPRGRAA